MACYLYPGESVNVYFVEMQKFASLFDENI